MGAVRLPDGKESLRGSRSLAGHKASSPHTGFAVVYPSSGSIVLEEMKTCFLTENGSKIC